MAEPVSYIHSNGALICVSSICVAAVVTYLALRSRGREKIRGFNHDERSTLVPLCKICHQLVKNAPSQDDGTKEWICSACSAYNHSTEVSPDARGDDQTSADLEIQQTLGSLAIGHASAISTPQSRDSPRSWLHLIKDLNLLPDQASNQNVPPHEASNEIGDENVADFSISQPSSAITLTVSDDEDSTSNYNAVNGCTARKPLIQPAKLRVRKRRFSISSATAALSLTGNGWDFNNNKDNGCLVNGEAPNPFLHVPDTRRCMNIRRNSAIMERQKVNYFQQGSINRHNNSSHFTNFNGNGLMHRHHHGMMNNHNTSLQDFRETLRLNSHATPTHPTYTAHLNQQSSSSSIPPSPLSCLSNEPHSTAGTPAAASNNRPWSNGVRCVVSALILFSVTANVVLLFLLILYVYNKPSNTSSVWVDAFSHL